MAYDSELHQQFAQKAFVLRAGEILAVQKSQRDPHNAGRWEVPGGRMRFGEDVDAHLVREVFEETGVLVTPHDPFHLWQWTMRDEVNGELRLVQVICIARECELGSECAEVSNQKRSDYLERVAWVPLDEFLLLDLIPSMRPAAVAFLDKHSVS